jgi:hypothetical protein
MVSKTTRKDRYGDGGISLHLRGLKYLGGWTYGARARSSFPPIHSLVSSICITSNCTMRIRCDGCGRAFAPSGLSQHLSKTRDLRCRRSLVQSDPASVSLSDRRVLDVDAPAPIRVSQDLRNANLVQTRDGMSPLRSS